MYIWRNKHRRDKRHNATDGHLVWGAPKGSENTLVIIPCHIIFIHSGYCQDLRRRSSSTRTRGEVRINFRQENSADHTKLSCHGKWSNRN